MAVVEVSSVLPPVTRERERGDRVSRFSIIGGSEVTVTFSEGTVTAASGVSTATLLTMLLVWFCFIQNNFLNFGLWLWGRGSDWMVSMSDPVYE